MAIRRQIDDHSQQQGATIERTVQAPISKFREFDDARRRGLSDETTNLVQGLTGLGRNMSELTGTLVEGGENIGDAMPVADLALNTVIRFFDKMQRLMDEIKSIA